jgi:hypothetical protein
VSRFTVSEAAAVQTRIGQLTLVTNHSTGSALVFNTQSGDVLRQFSVDADGYVTVDRPLDREVVAEYRLMVTVSTATNAISTSTATVVIVVDDVNDNIPMFVEPNMLVDVRESAPIGALLTYVKATDADADDNGRVVYEITSGNERQLFAMDTQTGAVNLRHALSHTVDLPDRLVVKASDGGKPPRSTIGSIRMHLVRENNASPQFPIAFYLTRMPESSPIGSLLFTVRATDTDAGEFGKMLYSLRFVMDYGVPPPFRIDQVSGEVRTSVTLDYETRDTYHFYVVATDGGGKMTQTNAQLLVTGVDEYAPVFDETEYMFRVNYESRVGDPVGTVRATDNDKGADGHVRYALVASMPAAAFFEIQSITGLISVNKRLEPLRLKSLQTLLRRLRRHANDADKNNTTAHVQRNQELQLLVEARSGVDPAMRAVCTVRVELGTFALAPHVAGLDTRIITVVSIVLVVLVILILLCLVCKLRRSVGAAGDKLTKHHKSGLSSSRSSHSNFTHHHHLAASGQPTAYTPSSTTTTLYAVGQPTHLPTCSLAQTHTTRTNPQSLRTTNISNTSSRSAGQSLLTQPARSRPQSQVVAVSTPHVPATSYEGAVIVSSNCGGGSSSGGSEDLTKHVQSNASVQQQRGSNRSSGHSSSILDACEPIRQTSQSRTTTHTRSQLDSGIANDGELMVLDDSASVASDLPSTADYLTSLGVVAHHDRQYAQKVCCIDW